MSQFILQTDSAGFDMEYFLIKEQLNKNYHVFKHTQCSLDRLLSIATKDDYPVGDTEFVSTFLKNFHGIYNQNPIEIPKYLRTERFLKRDYRIVEFKDIPKDGQFFLKDVSQLHAFSSIVNPFYEDIFSWFEPPYDPNSVQLVLNKEHLFQVSEVYDIEAEYRVYVCRGEIKHVAHFCGNALFAPDMELIEDVIRLILDNEPYLKSFVIDVMVGPKGTAIVEIRNFTSVNLYNILWGSELVFAYKDGIEYLLNDNRVLTPDK